MNLFSSIEKLISKTKNAENMPSIEVVDVVFIQSTLLDNQYEKNLKYYILLHQRNLMHIF